MPQALKQFTLEKLKFWKRPSLQNKTLWHWLELLVVPVVLATGAAFIQWQAGVRQENVTTDRNRQDTLAKYLEQMTTLLIQEQLRSSPPNSEVRVVARARTLTALRELDGERKGQLILFLAEAGLISKKCEILSVSGVQKQNCKPGIISLRGASLSRADVTGASVGRSKFTVVNLKGADLQGADLEGAKLQRVNLQGANLQEAELEGANLQKASLKDADLRSADLKKADLREAELRGACYDVETAFKYNFDPVSNFNPGAVGMVSKSKNQVCSP